MFVAVRMLLASAQVHFCCTKYKKPLIRNGVNVVTLQCFVNEHNDIKFIQNLLRLLAFAAAGYIQTR